MKTIHLDLFNKASINNAIRELQDYKRFIHNQIPVFIQRLAERGIEIYKVKWDVAYYDGTKGNPSVTIEKKNDKSSAVVSVGDTVLFVEFGTGIVYPQAHPDPLSQKYPPGSYGKHQALNGVWIYEGEPGDNGSVDKERPNMVWTHGNPANATMYDTVEQLKFEFNKIAKEVFKYD